jgi:hypothetical protein
VENLAIIINFYFFKDIIQMIVRHISESQVKQNNKEIQVLQNNLKRRNLSDREKYQIRRQFLHLLDANYQLKDQLER